jgi:hypothetical protein
MFQKYSTTPQTLFFSTVAAKHDVHISIECKLSSTSDTFVSLQIYLLQQTLCIMKESVKIRVTVDVLCGASLSSDIGLKIINLLLVVCHSQHLVWELIA